MSTTVSTFLALSLTLLLLSRLFHMKKGRSLEIHHAKENNLKDVSLSIPHDSFTVITGLSGSGKSSLAFDTIYAEGQRRYLETFSPYIRQFFDKVKKPNVESVENVRPTIAIQQRTRVVNSRSTVGSMTGILDYLRAIWNALSEPVCGSCGITLERWTATELAKRFEEIIGFFPEHSFLIAAALSVGKKKGALKAELARLNLLGFSRVLCPTSGSVLRIDGDSQNAAVGSADELLVVLDRMTAESFDLTRARESIDQAFALSQGGCSLIRPFAVEHPRRPLAVVGHEGENRSALGAVYDRRDFFERPQCPRSRQSMTRSRPALFSFNHPLGACPSCKGFGSILVTDIEKCIPNPNLSLEEGCIACWSGDSTAWERNALKGFCSLHKIPMKVPWRALTDEQREKIIISKTKDFWGIEPWFAWLEKKSYKMHVRVFLTRYRKQATCPTCNGSRLKQDSLGYQIDGLTIPEVWSRSIAEVRGWLIELRSRVEQKQPLPRELREVFSALESRLSFLVDLGLSYLTLDRQARTLSGGETQRVNLAGALGSGLTATHFVLDEPSVGLHPRDSDRLLASLKTLHANGNTVTVVEHDPQIISAAEEIIELGPGSGSTGGEIVYHGPAAQWQGIDFTPPVRAKGRLLPERGALSINGASARNIQELRVSLPLGKLICITGVSGCGKSTLVQEILAKEFERHQLGLPSVHPISGFNLIQQLLIVDQSPLAKTPRANIATYTKIWDAIRTLLADTPDARSRALTKSSFSFNVNAGRCLQCEGSGFIREDMQFLSDVYIECDACLGKRFQPSVLEVRWQGHSVDDLLHLSVDDAVSLFADYKGIIGPLSILQSLGLGHLTLGHSLSELSGGEAQRLKLVPLIHGSRREEALVIFDEPTTGLHVRDVFRLVSVCRELRDAGHTVVAIEHNLSFINEADWVIDMGPDGGAEGGRVLFTGTPDALAQFSGESFTAQYLKEYRAEVKGQKTDRRSPITPLSKSDRSIRIRGAREHNLRNITIEIPLGTTIALTGVSGSGKSTIARDILFAEGQRRYLDCLSPYAQQFIQELKRPDIDALENIPPSIYVSQHLSRPGPLSTLGTMTEVYNFLRLLFVKVGTQYCIDHPEQPIQGGSLADMTTQVRRISSSVVRILAPIISKKKGNHKAVFERARDSEISEVRVDGLLQKPSSLLEGLEKSKVHSIDFVIAKLNPSRTDDELISSAISLALSVGGGQAIVASDSSDMVLSSSRMCPVCKKGYLKLDPEDLSFHSKRGQCSSCGGLGVLKSGATCTRCEGSRLNPIGNSIRIGATSLGELAKLGAVEVASFLKALALTPYHRQVAEPILIEIHARLAHLISLGLGTIPLDRASQTVSGGELQRLRLAAAMGSPLSGVLYIFDEPSAGLHPSDNRRVLQQIEQIRTAGNTVVVIEHDPETIAQCEQVLAIGPGAGKEGGQVVFQGTTAAFTRETAGAHLFEVHEPAALYQRKYEKSTAETLVVKGSLRNIKNLDLAIPLNQLVVIAGVSGAGKSTLLHEMIAKTVTEGKKKKDALVLGSCAVSLPEDVARVITIDQTPIGTNSRSTPASYLKMWDEIRKLFATTVEAKTLGWTPADFSFNTGKGRCSECSGLGTITLEMNFLANASMTCEACGGKRFIDDIKHVHYNGRSITDVLSLTFGEARDLFRAHSKLHRVLSVACDLGLDYLSIGQCSSTLSGGEAQRIKLVQELAQKRSQQTLYLLDEPTIGLHRADVARLISVLHTFVEWGNSVLVIEHDKDLLLAADHVIELGPGAGDKGGHVVFAGSPAQLHGAHTPWGQEMSKECGPSYQVG